MRAVVQREWFFALGLFFLFGLDSALSAAPIVEFNAAKVKLDTEGASYVELGRPLDVDTKSRKCWNFDLEKPLFPEGPKFYVGFNAVNSADTFDPSFSRLHTNNPAGWPEKPMVFFAVNDTSGGTNQFDVTLLCMWKKADFAGVSARDRVAFDAASQLKLNVVDWYETENHQPMEIHFVVRNGSQYYISEAKAQFEGENPLPCAFTLADFNNNNAPGKRWASLAPTATSFGLQANPSYKAVKFDDVTEVGWIGQGSGAYLRLYGFDQFSADAVVGAKPATSRPASSQPAATRPATSRSAATQPAKPRAVGNGPGAEPKLVTGRGHNQQVMGCFSPRWPGFRPTTPAMYCPQ